MFSHLKAHSRCPATGAALGGDDAIGLQLLATKDKVAFRIKFGVGQHTAHRSMLMRVRYQNGQSGTVVPRGLAGVLGQNQLPLHIDHCQPFQPMLPGALRLTKVLYPGDEVTACCALCQTRDIDGYCGRTSPPPGHAAYDLVHHPRHIGRIEPGQKAIQRSVVRNGVHFRRRVSSMSTEPEMLN